MPEIMDQAQEQARKFGVGFEVMDDMEAAFKDADIIYAKSWGAMVHTADPGRGSQDHQQILALDHGRAQDGNGESGCDLHAPLAGGP